MRKLKFDVMRLICPMLFPSSRNFRMRTMRGLCMNITPSMNCTRFFLQAEIIS